ncbi:MAG TPA: NADH-quinone oxidoreductase subunit J [bacterium]|nr:NADH-quinone oxidoreductase subunit J [bacterium]
MAESILFYGFAAMILIAGLMVVISRNLFHAALWLALSLFGVAGIYVLLSSYFVAGIQVLIYIGAVVVLTIFVINMTREITGDMNAPRKTAVVPALLASALTAALIISAMLKTDWASRMSRAPASGADNTELIGRLLLTDFVVPFEAVSMLLLAALIGAVVIVSKDTGEKE